MSAALPEKAGEHARQVIDLHTLGIGRNEIARRLGISTYRVDQYAAEHGLTFDAAHTAKAVEVAVANAGRERRQLAARFRALAARALDKADLENNPEVMWTWLKSAATAVDKDAVIEQTLGRVPDDGTGGEAVASLKAFFRTSLGREDGGGSHD